MFKSIKAKCRQFLTFTCVKKSLDTYRTSIKSQGLSRFLHQFISSFHIEMMRNTCLSFLLLTTIIVMAQSRHIRHRNFSIRKLGAPGFHPRFGQEMRNAKSRPTGSILLLSMLNNLGSSVDASTTMASPTTEENLLRLY